MLFAAAFALLYLILVIGAYRLCRAARDED